MGATLKGRSEKGINANTLRTCSRADLNKAGVALDQFSLNMRVPFNSTRFSYLHLFHVFSCPLTYKTETIFDASKEVEEQFIKNYNSIL